jgi:hypothetical protein
MKKKSEGHSTELARKLSLAERGTCEDDGNSLMTSGNWSNRIRFKRKSADCFKAWICLAAEWGERTIWFPNKKKQVGTTPRHV